MKEESYRSQYANFMQDWNHKSEEKLISQLHQNPGRWADNKLKYNAVTKIGFCLWKH